MCILYTQKWVNAYQIQNIVCCCNKSIVLGLCIVPLKKKKRKIHFKLHTHTNMNVMLI